MHDEIEKIEKTEKPEKPNLPESAAPTENDARLILLYEIGRILASAETMNAAAPQILEAICRSLHFQLGELWCLGKNEDVLRFENDWHFPSPDVEKFLAESRRFEFAKGEGLPGQVWEKGEPILIKNFAAANFPRQPLAMESELRGAFAFPILLGEKTLGVFNFFSREILQPDELLLQMFVAVGNHVGQFIKREKIESKLRESEERFSKAFSASPLVLAISSLATGELIEVNETFVNATGFSRDEAIGKTTLELGLWAKPQERAAEMEIVRQQGQLSNVEYSFRTKNGDEIIGLLAAERIEIGGKPFALTVIQDITTRKRSEEALIKAERKAAEDYQLLLQRIVPLGQTLGTMRDLISVYRAVFEFVRTSMSCSAFFVSFFDAEKNLRRAAYVWGEGEEIDVAAFPPMPITPDGGVNSQAIFGKKTVIMNRYWDQQKNRPHVVLQDNGVDPQSSLVVPMVIKNEVIGTLEVQAHENKAFNPEQAIALEMVANLAAVAIENVRLLEIEAGARRIAEDANRAKDEFLSILSHELRTPLNAILGWTRLMKISSFDQERYNQAIETIERNARLQNNLIEDLLDVSRIISGKMRIEAERIDFVSAARSSLETVRPLAAAKNIALEFDTAENTLPINGDAARLQQIIVNLINNSVKFTPQNGSVTVRLLKKRKMARLEIIDTGIGISRDFLPHIFDRFRQADSTTQRHHSGLGLGLTIVRHLTQMHDGEVYAESDGEGKGAVFAVEIPLIEENEAVKFSEIKNPSEKQEQDRDVLRGKKILLVDDDGDGVYPVKLFLEKHGAAPVCAESACEGLEKFAETKFDLILSDIGMPEMDGYRLIEKVRSAKNNSTVPAIAFTAYASAEDRRRTLTAGFQAHLSKPLDFDELLQIIVEVFGENKKN